MESEPRSILAFASLGLSLVLGITGCSGQSTSDGTSSSAAPQTDAASPAVTGSYMFQLSGGGLQISYEEGQGAASVTYDDGLQSRTFTGSDVSSVASPAGTMVSVVTRSSVDTGSTTFSFLVPGVNLPSNTSAPIQTQGITAVHHFSGDPKGETGQLDQYSFVPLQGSVVGTTGS